MSPLLEVRGATVRFGTRRALADIDLAVDRGEVVAVLGPSGSGKSTLLRAVAGLQPLDAGRVVLGGRDVTDLPPQQRGVGLMFQDHALFPHRDVEGNVGFGLRMQRRAPAEIAHRVRDLLDLVGLSGFCQRAIDTLSGGEQQRVALARALAPEPAVLLLDEPLGALDRTLRDRLATDLRAVFTRLGLTVVLVTHDHHEAFSMADRLAIMDDGAVLQLGAPQEVWDQPASARVAGLLGFANIWSGVVVSRRMATPWGDVEVATGPSGPATVLIRPSGVRLPKDGTGVDAVAVACAFEGDRTSVRVAVPGAPELDALVATRDAPHPGDSVRVAVDPGAVLRLPA